MVSSRERVESALKHIEPDKVPLDLGGTTITGINASSLYQLRQALGLDEPGTPVTISEPFQMLGAVEPDLMDALGVDTVRIAARNNFFDFPQDDWKPWTYLDTPVMVPGGFVTEPDANGEIVMYPQGDRSASPSARMPKDGFYFDNIMRQEPIDEDNLDPADNLEEFGPIKDETLRQLRAEVDKHLPSGRALMVDLGGTSFGDAAFVPGPGLKHPRGIRDFQEWVMSYAARPEYVEAIFERQCEIGIENLEKAYSVLGDDISVLVVSGTDLGSQHRPFMAPRTYRRLFKPVHTRVNEWVHANTNWKTFIHTCGSIWTLLPDIVEAGFDALNPVQTSANDMDPRSLKETFGDRITFWGGGIDTQRVLPFGTPEEVREMVRERIEIFAPGGGFVFNTIHNIQAKVPVDNLVALYEAVEEYRGR